MSTIPPTPLYERALTSFRQGRLDEVERLCVQILQGDARHYAALNMLALVLLKRGELARGLELLRRSIEIHPQQADVHLNIARALTHSGQPESALASCETALALQPIQFEALQLRASLLLELNRIPEALADFDRALLQRVDSAVVHVNRGNALFRLDRVEEALASYARALVLEPQNADAQFNKGNALLKLNRWAEALSCYEAVAALRPAFAKGHYYRGLALRRLERPREALASFERALAIEPKYRDALCGLGNALRDLGMLPESLAAYDAALAIDPSALEALSNRGRVLLSLNRPSEAVECLERLFRVDPGAAADYNFALGNLLHARLMCCDWQDYQLTCEAIVASVLNGERTTLPPLLVAMSDSPAAQLKCARDFVEDNWIGENVAPARVSLRPRRTIRVAYVSADFRQHPVSQLMAGIFEQHDRHSVETIGVSLRPPDGSPLGERVRKAFDRFVDVSENSDAEAAAMMRDVEIDIAVDLTGYTDGFRAGIFARRAAPIQVAYLGYPGTLGAPYMDYLLADRNVVPEADQKFYAEKIVYLPECFQPNDAGREIANPGPTRDECALPESGFVFCCFNNQYKIQPPLFDIWMRLLHSIDGSMLWLSKRSDEVANNLRREAQLRGISPDRLIFAPRMPSSSMHLARYRLADLFLDTLPFNAHATASDALWAGLPVLTTRGNTFAGRVAASLLSTLGLSQLIAENLADYEQRALRLARERTELDALRARLAANRASSALFDTQRLCRHLESAYSIMCKRWQRGEAPTGFDVPPVS
jgi:protein O-GlcNAc transferase